MVCSARRLPVWSRPNRYHLISLSIPVYKLKWHQYTSTFNLTLWSEYPITRHNFTIVMNVLVKTWQNSRLIYCSVDRFSPNLWIKYYNISFKGPLLRALIRTWSFREENFWIFSVNTQVKPRRDYEYLFGKCWYN